MLHNLSRLRPTIALALALALAATLPLITGAVAAADYVQTSGSSLTFSGKYQGETFQGRFPGFATRFSFDPAKPATGRLDVVIPLVTATTGNVEYDGEMRGRAFFDSKRFAQAHYTASTFRALGGNRYAADGQLSLRGVSKPVTLTFTWTTGAKPVLSGTATVKRLDFGVGGGDWADVELIPNEIKVTTKVIFQPAPPAKAAVKPAG